MHAAWSSRQRDARNAFEHRVASHSRVVEETAEQAEREGGCACAPESGGLVGVATELVVLACERADEHSDQRPVP